MAGMATWHEVVALLDRWGPHSEEGVTVCAVGLREECKGRGTTLNYSHVKPLFVEDFARFDYIFNIDFKTEEAVS